MVWAINVSSKLPAKMVKQFFEFRTIDYFSYTAKKYQYYNTAGRYQFVTDSNVPAQYNKEINIALRKIINPVPMYARLARLEIPRIGEEVGFDLVKYDWVKPDGNGINSDFIFKLETNVTAWNDYTNTLTVTFPGGYDGLQ